MVKRNGNAGNVGAGLGMALLAGLHARNALLLSMKAKAYRCKIRVEHEGKTVDAKNVMQLLMLAARYEDNVTFFLEGEQENVAAKELKEYCVQNL